MILDKIFIVGYFMAVGACVGASAGIALLVFGDVWKVRSWPEAVVFSIVAALPMVAGAVLLLRLFK